MGDARLLTVKDALGCHRLVNELLELWDQPQRWQRHLADGLERIVGGFGAGYDLFQSKGTGWELLDAALSSSSDSAMQDTFLRCVTRGNQTEMPGTTRLVALGGVCRRVTFRFSAMPGGLSRYYQSDFYDAYLRPFSTGDTVTTFRMLPSGAVSHLTVLRARGDRPFSARASAIVAFMSEALQPHLGTRLLGTSEKPHANLSPRLRQTLELLLRGESEKRIAVALGLSPTTIHEYVGALYRRLGVHSRSELLSRYVRYSYDSSFH